jgi:hypothetical protein
MATQRSRRLFKFWLNLYNDIEYEIAESLEYAKRRREYTGIIRDGIRLILSLRQGRVDVLLELFPWLESEIVKSPTVAALSSQNGALQQQLERLEQLILQQGAVPVDMPAYSNNPSGPKALDVPRFDLPTLEDDDDDTIALNKDTSTNSAMNFVNSMLSLQQ